MKLGNVNKFLESIFKRSSFCPPMVVEERLNALFPEAVNIEWSNSSGNYEAIFFNDGIETIAWFSENGSLLKTRTNMPADELPQKVLETVSELGELMNAVHIIIDNQEQYEIIVRTTAIDRFVVVCNSKGEILRKDSTFN